VLKRAAENEAGFKSLKAPIIATAEQYGITKDGLQRKMIADAQVIENFGDEFGVFADRRVDGHANFHGGAERGVERAVGHDIFLKRITRPEDNVSEAVFCAFAGRDITFVRRFDFQSQITETFFHLGGGGVILLAVRLRVQPVKPRFVDFQV
jgi:hypothetical protein